MLRLALVAVSVALAAPSLAQEIRPHKSLVGGPADARLTYAEMPTAPLAELYAAHGLRGGSFVEVSLGDAPELDVPSGIALLGDGRMVVGGLGTGTVVMQEVETGELVWAAEVGTAVSDVAVGGGVAVAALGLDGQAVVLDLETGAVRHRVTLPGEPVQARVLPDGSLAFVASRGADQIAVIETATGVVRTTLDTPVRLLLTVGELRFGRRSYQYTPFEPTPDGRLLVVGTDVGATTFDVTTGRPVTVAEGGQQAVAIEIADGPTAVLRLGRLSAAEWPLMWYDLDTGATHLEALPQPANLLSDGALGVSPDGTRAVTNAGGDVLAVSRTGERQLLGRGDEIAPIGEGAIASIGATVFRIDLATLAMSDPVEDDIVRAFVAQVADGGDGQTVLWAVFSEQARRVSFDDPAPALTPLVLGQRPELDAPRFSALSPSGDRLAMSLYASGQIAVIDRASREQVASFPAQMNHPADLAFLSETELFVVGSDRPYDDGRIVRLDARTGALLQEVATDPETYKTVFVDRDRDLVYAHSNRTQLLTAYRRVGGELRLSAAFSAGGLPETDRLSLTIPFIGLSPSRQTSVGVDPIAEEIVVTDLVSGLRTSVPVSGDLDQVAFTADGRMAGVTSWDGALHLVDLSGTPALIETLPFERSMSGIAFDADAGVFVVAALFKGSDLFEVDPASRSVVGQRALPDNFAVGTLDWSAETGLVASGLVDQLGFSGESAVWAERVGVVPMPGLIGRTLLAPADGEILATLTAADGLGVIEVRETAQAEAPAADVSLTALGTPSPRLRVRLAGAPRARARVEVVDLLGRVVAVLHDGPFSGRADLAWDGAATGTYVVRLVGTGVTARATVVR